MAVSFLSKTIFEDNVELRFGDGEDLRIYHDGSSSRIVDGGTGNLLISGTNLILNDTATGENFLRAVSNGAVQIYHNGSEKFITTSTGIDVTGTVNLDNLTINGGQGSDGQVLTSTGSGVAWENAASGGGTVISVGILPGTGLDVSGSPVTSSGNITLTLDLSELTDMTGDIDPSVDEIILLDNGSERRKRFAEIFGSNAYNSTTIPTNNNQLTNGAGYITDGNTGWNNTYGFITASSSDTLTNKGGNISQWTNDSGYITSSSLPTVNNGTLTLSTSAGLDGSASFTANQSGNSTFTVSLDLSELTDMTGDVSGANDELILLDSGAERRKRIGEIKLGQFNNDQGWTSNTGSMTSFILTGDSGTSQSISNGNTLDIAGGTNISTVVGSTDTVTINMDTGGIGSGTYGSTADGTKIDQITVDAYGRITAVTTGATGTGSMSSWTIKEGNGTESTTVTNGETLTIAQGTGIQSEMTSTSSGGTITITNTAPDTGTPAILSNGSTPSLNSGITGAEVRSLIGAGTGSGDITAVTAGSYLSGGATSGSATLNLDYGVSGNWWDKAVVTGSTGVTEIGKYIDFHESDGHTGDYNYRITSTSGRLYFSGDIEVDGGDIYINDSNTRITEGTSNTIRLQTNSGYVDIGPQNTSYAHFSTDRGQFYFNEGITVNTGDVRSYDEDLTLSRAGLSTASIVIASGETTSSQNFRISTPATDDGAILDLQSNHSSGYNDSRITFSASDGDPDGTIIYKNQPFKTQFELHTQTTGTSGTPSLTVDNTSSYFINKVYAKEFIDRDSTSYKIHPGGTDSRLNYLKVGSTYAWSTNSSYLSVGVSTGSYKPLFRTVAMNSYPTWNIGWEHDTVQNSTYGDAARFKLAGSLKGYIRVNSSSVTYSTSSSDERLKKNIETWNEDILSKFEAIEPKKFHFDYQEDSDEKIKGYVAQQMVDKFPEAYPLGAIDDGGEEYYSFDPGAMAVYLMKAVKDLIQENKQLKQRVEALENA